MKNKFLSTQQLGALLGVTRQTIRNWIKKGDIKAFHIGQNLKIPVDEAHRLLKFYGLPFPDWLQEDANPYTAQEGTILEQPRPQAEQEASLLTFSPTIEKSQKKASLWTQEAADGR